jgi:hypothetical protein
MNRNEIVRIFVRMCANHGGGELRIPRPGKTGIFLLVVVVIVVAAFTYVVGPLDSVPRKRASATSPDGALTVEVFKQRLSLFPKLRVGILVRVTDQTNKLLYEKIIFEEGWWNADIGEMFKQITFSGDEIRIGPMFSPDEYFTIRRPDRGPAP